MSAGSRERHVPQRSCVVCGKKSAKRELMRIVATPQGVVEMDPTGKLPGRGAYVCADGKCSQGALQKGRIEQALRTRLNDDDWGTLTAAIEGLTVEATL